MPQVVGMKSGWQRRTSLSRMWTSEETWSPTRRCSPCVPESPGDKKKRSVSYEGLNRSGGHILVSPSRIRTFKSFGAKSGVQVIM